MKSSFDLILKNATCVVPRSPGSPELHEQLLDIGVINGKITELGNLSESQGPSLNLKDLHVLPGLIDTQVHFREPGLTYKEDIESGSRSALFGGLTGFFEMPNTKPPTTSLDALQQKFDLAHNRSHVNYAFYGGSIGEHFEELEKQESHPNCPGIKIFMGTSTGGYLVDQDEVLEKILQVTKRRLVVHCEDEPTLQARKHLVDQDPHPRSHPIWRNEESALRATQRIVALARKYNHKLHILHITTAEEVEFLKDHQDLVTFEVLPQHLTLAAPECYEKLGTLAQMNPPIRDIRHQQALWKAVNNNLVKVMGSDHAPHLLEEKARPYPQSPSGIPGVQTLVPLMLNHVNNGKLPLTKVVELLCQNPCQIFGVKNKGQIAIGKDADFSIVDMKKIRTVENKWIQSKCHYSPYDGMKLQGWPHSVILNGELIFSEDQILKPSQGQAFQFQK